ncbi:MAG: class I SAM-dependent methyltransferase [Planctomycetes bacterium]|nr:class I SAM-dependent methyltransferase [Planctomycetota bacterium]
MAYRWDERYDQENFIFGTEPNDFLKQEAYRIPAGGKVLCLGDGEGRNGVWLAEQGFQVTSVDLSQVGLDKTQRFADQRGVQIETIYADLAEWHIEPQAWDGIVSIFCHMMPDERKKMHPRIVKGLQPGGVFLLEAYTPDQINNGTGGPSNPDLLVTTEDLTPELKSLDIQLAHNIEREVIEGISHTGLASVTQIIGEKK